MLLLQTQQAHLEIQELNNGKHRILKRIQELATVAVQHTFTPKERPQRGLRGKHTPKTNPEDPIKRASENPRNRLWYQVPNIRTQQRCLPTPRENGRIAS